MLNVRAPGPGVESPAELEELELEDELPELELDEEPDLDALELAAAPVADVFAEDDEGDEEERLLAVLLPTPVALQPARYMQRQSTTKVAIL